MADHDNYNTYVRETRTSETSGAGIALIVGGLVVAVGFVLWLVFGGPGPVATPVETVPAGDTTNVTIEPPAAPVDNSTNLTIEPEADPVAPVDPAAPVDDTGTAPVTDGAVEPAPVDE
jgi:hypothetical protein